MAETRLVEFCNPVFRQIIEWGRVGADEKSVDPVEARSVLVSMLDRMRLDSRQNPQLGQQFLQVELPLLFFIDFIMHDVIETGGSWQEMAFERNELAGDEKFFDLLEQTLGNPTDPATERIGVFYQCMALGFTGTFEPNSPDLYRLFRRCALRLGLAPEIVESGQLTPEAYENLDLVTRHRPFDPRKWRRAALIAAGLLIAVHITNLWIFNHETGDVLRQIDRIGTYANLAPVYRESDGDGSDGPPRIPKEDRVAIPTEPGTSKAGGTKDAPVESAPGGDASDSTSGEADGEDVKTVIVMPVDSVMASTPLEIKIDADGAASAMDPASISKTSEAPADPASSSKASQTPVDPASGTDPALSSETSKKPAAPAPDPASDPASSSKTSKKPAATAPDPASETSQGAGSPSPAPPDEAPKKTSATDGETQS